MGRNGSGKSTLLKLLSGIYQPSVALSGPTPHHARAGTGHRLEPRTERHRQHHATRYRHGPVAREAWAAWTRSWRLPSSKALPPAAQALFLGHGLAAGILCAFKAVCEVLIIDEVLRWVTSDSADAARNATANCGARTHRGPGQPRSAPHPGLLQPRLLLDAGKIGLEAQGRVVQAYLKLLALERPAG